MNNGVRQFFSLVIILILLVGSGWYYSRSNTMIRLDRESLANSVDTTIVNVNVRQFNTQGTLANLLSSPLMQHIQKDDIYLLQDPHVVVSQDDGSPWDISSKKAKSLQGGKAITFSENVIVRQNKGNSQESTLKTEEVTYYPKEKTASSNVLVTYEQPGNIIQSTGMMAYLDQKRVELLHQARGSYVPTNG